MNFQTNMRTVETYEKGCGSIVWTTGRKRCKMYIQGLYITPLSFYFVLANKTLMMLLL